MNQQTASKMLQVTGIIMIIGGAIGLIGAISLIFLSFAATAVVSSVSSSAGSQLGGLLTLYCIVALIAAVAELVAGILGAANHNKPEKAKSCLIFGIIVLAIGVLSLILSFAANSFSFNSLLSFVLPVLYTIGAYFNSKFAGQQF